MHTYYSHYSHYISLLLSSYSISLCISLTFLLYLTRSSLSFHSLTQSYLTVYIYVYLFLFTNNNSLLYHLFSIISYRLYSEYRNIEISESNIVKPEEKDSEEGEDDENKEEDDGPVQMEIPVIKVVSPPEMSVITSRMLDMQFEVTYSHACL